MASNTNSGQKPNAAHKPLLFLVIAMGLMLVGGTVLLVGKLVSGPQEKAAKSGCEPQQYALPAGTNAQILAIDGAQVTMMVTTPDNARSIRTIDSCSGKSLRELQLVVEP